MTMKKAALIYALWEKNLTVLEQYLSTSKRVVIIPASLNSAAMNEAVKKSGSELHVLSDDSDMSRIPALMERLKGDAGDKLGLSGDENLLQMLAVLQSEVLSEFPRAHGLINALETLVDRFEIEVAVLNEDVLLEGKTLALWARAYDIPVVQVAHGAGIGTNYAGEISLSDHVAVPSRRSSEYFLDMGVPASRIHLVGNPHWDVMPSVVKQRDSVRETLGNAHGLPLDQKWIVWGSTWNAHLSMLDRRDHRELMVQACEALLLVRQAGMQNVWLIYKDRPAGDASVEQMRTDFAQIAQQYGVVEWTRYALEDARYWCGCADVVVSYDSNMTIEAMLVDVPAINLMSDFGSMTGGGYGANDGVLVLEPLEVPSAILSLLIDESFRQRLLNTARANRSYFHFSENGGAAKRIVDLIKTVAKPLVETRQPYVWEQYLNIEFTDVEAAYHAHGRPDLANMYTINPRIVLDIGCAAGGNGALIKQRFPEAQVWGIETNRGAAKIADERLDKVLVGMFEDFDLQKEGLAHGTLDGVLLADVLEHMYNPWDVMVKLRPYMSEKGQLVLSIPNVRNLALLDDLSQGNWNYASAGLLDITHIRFFTYKEILKFCAETGYRVLATHNAIDGRLVNIMNQLMPSLPGNVEINRMIYKNVTPEELHEMCTLQFHILLEKDSRN